MRPLVEPRVERLEGIPTVQNTPETARQLETLWEQAKGIDSFSPRPGPEYAEDLCNYMLEDAKFVSRLGTEIVGGSAASQVLQTTDFVRSNGKKVTIRFCLRHIEILNYSTGVWRSFSIAFNGSALDLFTWTSWADKLIFSNFVDGMWELDFQTYVIKKIPGAPGCKHLTTFGGRIIATAVNFYSSFLPYRIQWSVKNNYLDWTGLGSGYEDLFGSPSGIVDEAMGVFPATDEAAFVVRAVSCWQMSLSGNALAPFRFSRIAPIGSPYRYSVVQTARGVVFVGIQSVHLLSVQGLEDIGWRIKNTLHDLIPDARFSYGLYDPYRDEYRLAGGTFVFRYRWIEGGWTRDEYSEDIISLGAQFRGKTGYPIDSLPGIIDALPGIIDDLVINRFMDDKIYLVPQTSFNTLRETDSSHDTLSTGGIVNAPTSISPGNITLDILKANEWHEIHLEYEAEEDQTMIFEMSRNAGATYLPQSVKPLLVTAGSEIARVKLSENSRKFKLQLTSDTLGKLVIQSLSPALVSVERAR